MKIIQSPSEMLSWARGKNIALVPTMGNLHEGHLSLVDQVQNHAEHVVVSIFVNPAQFGPTEDFDSYPRTFEEDCALLKARNVSVVFAPTTTDMYPADLTQQTFIKVPGLSDGLCASTRPVFFQGIATVVCKLFQIVQPTLAIFGEKDYQQLSVIRRMVKDLSMPINILSGPTVREKNGLAMSSRNRYLTAEQREQAALLYQTLSTLVEHAKKHDNYQDLTLQCVQTLNQAGFNTDYVAIRRQEDLQPPSEHDTKLIVLAAAMLGKTRLIDNIAFHTSETV